MTCPRHRAFARADLLVLVVTAVVGLAVLAPLLGAGRTVSGLSTSFMNLARQGAAHATYAADWNGRQLTQIVDDISAFGDNANDALNNYNNQTDGHPDIVLGEGCIDDSCGLWRYQLDGFFSANFALAQPITFGGPGTALGAFRLHNTRPLHDYLSGRFYDPVFYAPRDTEAWRLLKPVFSEPFEYVPVVEGISQALGSIPAWSSYATSPAAMFDPAVMRSSLAGGWQDPWSLDDGFASPGLFTARHPSLKTHVLEHHWNQNRPTDPCNPGFSPGTFDGCEPYYFNHGLDSEPATLFYDMSVRVLPNQEAVAADAAVQKATGAGLWSRDTNFGANGYFNDQSFDTVDTSHHVLTTDGILGRDTTAK